MAENATPPGWERPGRGRREQRPFLWRHVVWAIIYPRRQQHMTPTVPGVLLIGLSLGIGTAAYNASNNILFITLALLLACLILSGVLSWLNFSRLRWRLLFPAAAQAGQSFNLTLELANDKKVLPTYGLECVLTARPASEPGAAPPQSTFTAKGRDVKAILKRMDEVIEGKLWQRGRLEPGGTLALDWAWTPARRGRWEVSLVAVGSLFPFGFFHKKLGAHLRRVIIVRPAPVDYQRLPAASLQALGQTARLAKAGPGSDLLALRRYAPGDSHRLINWKASARSGRLLVRQFAAEAAESYTLILRTDLEMWPRAEQFEKFISLAATLAGELSRANCLREVFFDAEAPLPVRHGRDLEAVLDALAVRQPARATTQSPLGVAGENQITFRPDGLNGVIALLDGNPAATA